MTGSESVSAVLLVVDPDPSVADDLQMVLTENAHHIDIKRASNWAAAIENVTSVDCMVTEYDLPETDGLEVLSQVKQERPDLPVILYTDAGDETIASRAISAGVTDYLQKDSQDLDRLATRIVQAIQAARTTTRSRELNRINAVIQEIDAALVRAETRSQVEDAVCDILADADPYLFAWIGEYEPAHNRLVPRASAGLEDGFLHEIPLGEESTVPESRAGARTIETGQVAVSQNAPDDAVHDDASEEFRNRENLSLATVPIAHGDDRYGLLAVYADRPSAFHPEERELLEKLGRDVGYTINAVAVRSELQDFSQAVEHAGHAVCITDADGTIEHVNPAFEVQTGYDESTAVGSTLSSIQSLTPDETTLEPGEETTHAFTATRKNGTTYEAEQTIAPIADRTGDPQGFVVIQADVTERREKATALRRETEMLNSLLETSPIGIVVLSPAGEIVRANRRAETVLGLEESEIVHRTYDEPQWEFTDESGEPIPRSEHPFDRVVAEQAPIYDLELRMERQHADPIWISINGAPQFDPDGDLKRVVFTFDDITEIKETQTELAEINQTLEALIQAAPVGIVAFDLDGGISLWSDGAEDIFGWSANEVLGSHDPPHVQEEAVNEYETFIERLEQGEELTGLHVVRQRKDGSEVDLHLSAAPIRDTHGWVTGLMAVFADLSDQMAREQQLRQFRKAVEHAGHSVLITDSNGKIQYVNAAFEEQTGYSTEEALGRTPSFLKSGEHEEAFYEEMWETIQRGDVWEREIINRRKDGEKIYVEQTIAPVLDEEGEIEHFVAVNTDITDRKEYEWELERQNQRLEEFASVVSHDLRNPLNVAKGSLAILDVDGEHAVRLADALDRMDAIIDDVLTLAREGQSMTAMGSVDLETAVQESWEAIGSVEAELSVEDLPTVSGDGERAQRIFENLFRNAVEHGSTDRRDETRTREESGSRLHIRVGSLDSGGFFVEDNGPGIDPELEETVFRSGVTTSENGTGLGLSIVRRLAEAQGWSVSLEEGRMGGARFEFRTDP